MQIPLLDHYDPSMRLNPEELDPEAMISWHRLSDPEAVWLSSWQLIPQHDIGCKYDNRYNMAYPNVFNYPSTRIHPEVLDPKVLIPWHCLNDPEVVWLSPWQYFPLHDIGCKYINTPKMVCSDVFNWNTSIQITKFFTKLYTALSQLKKKTTNGHSKFFALSYKDC